MSVRNPMTRRATTSIGVALLVLALWAAPALAGPGDIDPTFDQDGRVAIDSGGIEVARALALQPDGKILVAGVTGAGLLGNDAAVYRLNPNGSFDSSFDGDGSLAIDSGGVEFAAALALQPDGKILLAGATTVDNNAVVYRLQGDPPPPTITSFTPTSGATGSSVTITGTNLTGTTAVTFGGIGGGTFTVDSPTQITATVPTLALTGPISVTTPGGTATSSTSFTVSTGSTSHSREISLSLRKKAKGTVSVSDGFGDCAANVPVKLQHREGGRWQTIANVDTKASGAYSVAGVDDPGKYRSIAKQVVLPSGDTCLKDVSPTARR